MQRNIKHKGQGEHNNKSAYGVCASADAASLLKGDQRQLTYALDKQLCKSVRTTFHNEMAHHTAETQLEDDVAGPCVWNLYGKNTQCALCLSSDKESECIRSRIDASRMGM